MDATREIAKYGNRSVVEITTEGRVVKYAAVTDYDETKELGSRWNWGHYYDIYGDMTQEEALKGAMLDLYGINDDIIAKANKYDRMKKIASDVLDLYLEIYEEAEGDIDDAAGYLKNNLNVTKEEAEELGVNDLLFPKKYKIVDVYLKREQTVTIKAVVPNDEDVNIYDIDNYISGYDYAEPEDDGDWEVDYVNTYDKDLSKSDVKRNYSEEDVWNYEDLDDM